MGSIVGSRTVNTQPDPYPLIPPGDYRGDATGETHIAARTMGNTGSGPAKKVYLWLAHVNAMGVPDVVAGPTQRFDVGHRPLAEGLQAKFLFFNGFSQVCVQTNAVSREPPLPILALSQA